MFGADTFDFTNEIAVIGMVGRFPGARNTEQFWQNLCDGVESISFFSDEELSSLGIEPAILSDPRYVKAGGILEDAELFDASFFGVSPREAEIMDPQHRFFLECAWQALENAGYDSEIYTGLIGVYAGTSTNTYLLSNLYPNLDRANPADFIYSFLRSKDYLTTIVSYKLNLTGPSVTVQTFCSTSLVAVHLACQSLLNGECDMALAGGVSLHVPQKTGYLYQEGGIQSSDGHVRAFDTRADGTVFSNGVGIVVLKRLADALADGDAIHAIIKGSAINNDGSLKAGFTAPSVVGQAKVIAEALAIARVEPETIRYIETHGTGTSLGDPIEIRALTKAFSVYTRRKGFCAIGSVKTNIGHLDAAAGIASLIKAILILKHGLIPPSLHFEQPNPKIDFADSPFYVNDRLAEWRTDGPPRRAGVTSLGFGGTNAHIILEEAPPVESSGASRPWHLLTLSAKTSSALESATTRLAGHLVEHPDLNLADVAYTLQGGRRVFNHRRVLVCENLEEAVKAMETRDPERVFTAYQEPGERATVFMFPGQGAQYVNMGLALYGSEPTFREQVDRCAEFLLPLLKLDVRSVIYPQQTQSQAAAQQLKQTAIAQPALFVIEYALARLWMEWGVSPKAMIGHSIGEYVAACLANVFSLQDALTLVAARGRLMQELPGGAMLSLSISEKELQPFLDNGLSLAAINGPSQCVVSGPEDAVATLERQLTERDLPYRRLHTSHAFHSQMMTPVLEPFLEQVKQTVLNPPQIPCLSNVTGNWLTDAEATEPNYWASHLRQPVRFADGLQELFKQETAWLLLEVGPGRTLGSLAKQHPDKAIDQVILASLPHPQDRQSDGTFILNTLGRLWMAGAKIDWTGFYKSERRHRLPLPTYPFERQRYWIDPPSRKREQHFNRTAVGESPGKKADIADWFYVPFWKPAPSPIPLKSETERRDIWLVFADECGVGNQVIERLEKMEQTVVRIQAGQRFAQLRDGEYVINPRQCDDYVDLVAALCAADLCPTKIAHLWGVTSRDEALFTEKLFEEAQYSGFYSLLFLTQALGRQSVTEPLQIWIVTNNVQAVTGETSLCPEKATVLGPAKVIPQEHLQITCHSIDIVLPELETWRANRLMDQLVAEMQTDSSELIVAYRNHQRLVQTFEPIKLREGIEATGRLRENGVYLITGGLDSIGFAFSEAIAQTVQANLILVEDADLPARDQWGKWLTTHDDRDHIAQKIQNVQALEAIGAETWIVRADVSNLEQMQTVIAQIDERFGALHGVIYAAGIVGEKPLSAVEETGPSEYAWHTPSKIFGLIVLERVLQERALDFCLLQSSLSAVLGGLGAAASTAADLFMAGFVSQHNHRHPVPWTSIHWDLWRFDQDAEISTNIGASLADLAMTFRECGVAFQRLLAGGVVNQIVVSTGDLQARLNQWIKLDSAHDLSALDKSAPASRHSRPNLPTVYVAPGNEIERTVANIWQELLGVEPIGIHDDFFELGGHSLLATQLVSRLRHAFKVELPLRTIFESATVAGLCLPIAEKQFEQLDKAQVIHLLTEIRQLSQDQVRARLSAEKSR